MSVTINGTSGLVFNDSTTQGTSAFYGGLAFRNRIINGSMVIDQRNAGASVAITTSENYITDRFFSTVSANSKLTGQQNAGSVTPPAGFANYLGMTVAVAANVTVGASDVYAVGQQVEGFNTADLAWGTASASAVTLSFWVRSSLTGTFGGSLRNSAGNRSYPFTYVISSANTWEQKSVTIAGDTSGTWLTTNGIGIRLLFSLGSGTTVSGTAGAWAGANYTSATGAVELIETNSATFYITGVQLEKGSTATSFDYRPYGTELALCQRYCVNYRSADSGSAFLRYGVGQCDSTTNSDIVFTYPVPMRVTPTVTTTGTASNYGVYSGGATTACSSVPAINPGSSYLNATITASVASGLTLGRACTLLSNNNNTSYLLFSAEL
jgi:hypothetical protein